MSNTITSNDGTEQERARARKVMEGITSTLKGRTQ